MRPKSRSYHSIIIATGSSLLAVSSASAGTLTWDNNAAAGVTGGAGTWNTTDTNWTTDAGATRIAWENLGAAPFHDAVITANPTASNVATITVSGSISLRNLTINTNATNNSAYTITGGTLAFTGGTITFPTSSQTHTISSNVTGNPNINTTATGSVARRFDFTAPANGTMNLGNITSAVHSSADHVSTINLGGGANSTGQIGSSLPTSGTGVGNRLYFNSGTWTLNGSAYSRDQWINGATVTIASGGQLRSSTREVLLSSGTLNYNHAGAVRHDNTTFDTGRIFRITGGTLNQTSGTAITTSTHNPDMAWHGNFTFSGTNGANSDLFLGTGRISLGQATRIVTVTDPATTLSVGGVISNTGGADPTLGTGSLTKAGAGTLKLSGTSANTYTGTTTINGGTLALGKTAGVNAIVSTAITLGDGATTAGNDILRLDASDQIANASVITFSAATGGNAGIFRLNNRSETVAGIASTGGGGIIENESGSAGTSTLTVNNAATQSFSGIIRNGDGNGTDGTLALTKSGSGTLTLSGTNSYTGATSVNAGTLSISSTGSTHASSAVTVSNSGSALVVNGTVNGTLLANANTTVSGAGTVVGNTTISGLHSPGNSPGILTHTGNLSYEAGASVLWELIANSTTVRGTNFDGINVGGALAFNAATTLNLDFDFGSSAVEWQDTFWETSYIGTNGWLVYSGATSLTGFNNLSLNSPASWLDESQDTLAGIRPDGTFSLFQSGNNIYLNYTVIPEPSASLLGGLGLLALLRRRRG